MKTCVVYGDLQSDRTAEQYPCVTLCDACIEDDRKAAEGGRILFVQGESVDDVCEWCGLELDQC